MHRLLKRQLKRYFGDAEAVPEEWQSFLQAVNDAYYQFEDDRAILERSLEVSSQELLQANTQLQELLKTMEAQVKTRTAELTQANMHLAETLGELQRTQLQLVQAEKMSSLGRLVAGLAHELNNPTSFIHGNLYHLENYTGYLLRLLDAYEARYPEPGAEIMALAKTLDVEFIREDLPPLLRSVQSGTRRIRDIVESLRNFARLDEAEFKTADIHEGLDGALLILAHRLKFTPGPGIQVHKRYGPLPRIECYPGQLNQVLLHILDNAVDAIEEIHTSPQEAVGQICIETRALDEQWVEVAIANTGQHIPEWAQSHIFDPFFTTKPVGQGTGMGMAISYQIIERHGGHLSCSSAPGETRFVIQLPVQRLSTVPQ